MDEKIEKAIKPLVEMYENIENELLEIIARHFLFSEEFENSDYWRIKKLDEMGLFNQEIVEYIARYSNKSKEEVRKALNEIGIETVNIDNLNRLFEDEVLKINPNILVENYTIQNIINFAYNEISNRFIEMSDKIEQATRDAYLNVIEECYLKTSMGTHSYQEAIRQSIDNLGNIGITTLIYNTTDEEGNVVGIRRYDVAGTARREILTGARQLSNNVYLEVANKLEVEYLYLSEHLQCRPEHFDWQGTIIKREDLVDITDYGSITGLGGINCKHYAEPYFGDKRGDELKTFTEEETSKAYELSQKQRYLERGVRKWKRKAEMFKVNGDKEAYVKSKKKVKEWQLRVKEFTEQNDLRRDYTREYISKLESKGLSANSKFTIDNHPKPEVLDNIKLSNKNIEKTFSMYENQIRNDTIENAIVITKSGKVYQCFGNSTNVWPDIDLGDELKEAYVSHNHPKDETYYSFSEADIKLFDKYKLSKLRGVDNEYTYELDRTKGPILDMPIDFDEEYGLEHLRCIQYAIDNDICYTRWKNE